MSEHEDGQHTITLHIERPPTTTVLVRQLMGWLPLIVGAAIAIGGPGRFTSRSTAYQRGLAPWWVWALMFGVTGAWLVVTATFFTGRRVFWPALANAAVMWFWVLCLVFSAFRDPKSGFVALGFCLWAAVAMSGVAIKDRNRDA